MIPSYDTRNKITWKGSWTILTNARYLLLFCLLRERDWQEIYIRDTNECKKFSRETNEYSKCTAWLVVKWTGQRIAIYCQLVGKQALRDREKLNAPKSEIERLNNTMFLQVGYDQN